MIEYVYKLVMMDYVRNGAFNFLIILVVRKTICDKKQTLVQKVGIKNFFGKLLKVESIS